MPRHTDWSPGIKDCPISYSARVDEGYACPLDRLLIVMT
jgi:hypothetical protein